MVTELGAEVGVRNSCLSPACAGEAQGRLSSARLDLRRGFSGGKRLREGIGVAPGSVKVGGPPPAWLRLSFLNSRCCGQGLRVGDTLC